jgi:hypothetical protein
MFDTTKALRIAIPAVLAVGVASAVVFGRARERRTTTIPAETMLVAALNHEVSTAHARPGDDVELHTTAPLRLGDAEIPAGVVVRGTVTESKGGGRVAGAPELGLRFTSLEVDGDSHTITAEPFWVQGRNDAKQSALQIGGGAVAGGVLGRVFGGRGGTLKGAVVGAAIGTGVAVATLGDQIVLAAGQQIKVHLNQPVTVTYHPRSQHQSVPR